MEPLVFYNSRGRFLALAAGCGGFAGLGGWILRFGSARQQWIGWANLLFFGTGAGMALRQLLDTRPRLRLDDAGIFDRTLGVGVIPWSAIGGARPGSVQGQRFIALDLHEPAQWVPKMKGLGRLTAKANRAVGAGDLNVNLIGLDADPARVLEAILRRIAR